MLRALLPTDADFGAFCGDFFPAVADRCADGMDRVAKVTLLLELEDAHAILAALEKYDPRRIAKYQKCRDISTPLQKNPYRGLSAFQSDEAHLFFGREALTASLWQKFESFWERPDATRLLAILGPSGSGKSSIARAGLLAALIQTPVPGPEPMRLAVIKPGERPIENLARALVPLLPLDFSVLPTSRQVAIEKLLRDEEIPHEGLRRLVADLPNIAASPLLVFVDQFEELYTLCKDLIERDNFVATLIHAASDTHRHVSIVLTLRSDFLGEIQRQHADLSRIISSQNELVLAMSTTELRDAIAKPAEQAGHQIDDATVDLLLTESRGSHGALPLLEFALTQIWEGVVRGDKPGVTLRRIGGVGGALAGEAQKIYQSLSPQEQATARRSLVRLVRLGEGTRDTRRRAPISELCGQGETESTVLAVLRKFAAAGVRLVTLSGEESESLAEVTHESLFDHWTQLRTWIEQGRKDRGLYDRALEAAKLWRQASRPAGRLWRPPDLDLLRDYQRRKPDELGPLLTAFLSAAQRRQRTERGLSLGAVVAMVAVLLIATGVYVAKERQRTREASESKERIRQQLLDTYVEQGRELLFEQGKAIEGLLWLHRAQQLGSKSPALTDLLKSSLQNIYTTRLILSGHRSTLMSATYSPNGSRIVTASMDKTARVWDADSGRLLAELKGHGDVVNSATYSPDGNRIITASWDKTTRIWEANSGRLIAELIGHKEQVHSATYSPDGRRILTASADGTARIWEANSKHSIIELKGHRGLVATAMYSPDGNRILTASWDKTVRIWDANSGRLLTEIGGYKARVNSATYSPDGTNILVASMDNIVRVWAADSGRLLAELKGHDARLNSAAYSPDGTRILTTNDDNTARIWEADSGRLLAELKGHGHSVYGASYSPDGHRIVTASVDSTARIWEVDSSRLVVELKGHRSSVLNATYSPDGRHILTASGESQDRLARFLDASADLGATPFPRDSARNAIFSADGHRAFNLSLDNTVRVWEADSGRLVAELRGHQNGVNSAAYSPDGRCIVTASHDNTVRIWEADSGRFVFELKCCQNSVNSAAYSPDGRRIVTAGGDNTVRVWEADSGRLVFDLRGHQNSVNSATYSPDGRRIVTASRDNTARVWEADSGRLVVELKGHAASVKSAAYRPDGRRIVTASADNTARVWEADSGCLVVELKGHAASVNSAMYSPNGHRIVTASDDRTARIWEADSGRSVAELRGHEASIYSAVYSPDGRRIVTASDDGKALIWDTSPETRTAEQITQLIRCHIPARFESDGSNIIIFETPNSPECQSEVQPHL